MVAVLKSILYTWRIRPGVGTSGCCTRIDTVNVEDPARGGGREALDVDAADAADGNDAGATAQQVSRYGGKVPSQR